MTSFTRRVAARATFRPLPTPSGHSRGIGMANKIALNPQRDRTTPIRPPAGAVRSIRFRQIDSAEAAGFPSPFLPPSLSLCRSLCSRIYFELADGSHLETNVPTAYAARARGRSTIIAFPVCTAANGNKNWPECVSILATRARAHCPLINRIAFVFSFFFFDFARSPAILDSRLLRESVSFYEATITVEVLVKFSRDEVTVASD